MRVDDVMTRDAHACNVDDTLENACRIMWDCDCGVVPVVDGNTKVVAVVTDRDACMAALHQRKALHELPVRVAMSSKVWSLRPEDSIDRAERVMQENQVRRLPVTGFDGRLVGILSLNDIARQAVREHPQNVADTLAAIGEPQKAGAASPRSR
jgi:CBS domain-containing protein